MEKGIVTAFRVPDGVRCMEAKNNTGSWYLEFDTAGQWEDFVAHVRDAEALLELERSGEMDEQESR